MFNLLSKEDKNISKDITLRALKALRDCDKIDFKLYEDLEKYQDKNFLHSQLTRKSYKQKNRIFEDLTLIVISIQLVYQRYGNFKSFKRIKDDVLSNLIDINQNSEKFQKYNFSKVLEILK